MVRSLRKEITQKFLIWLISNQSFVDFALMNLCLTSTTVPRGKVKKFECVQNVGRYWWVRVRNIIVKKSAN
ncbi:MAG: hypothetical protein MRECE_59c002 [Mycoplasmataceae bacterium CE_OT135]|nr:MAG: hypothetical protein MRECE_59c002 [Mycoplasmataceae bacterium CE_OT135]